MASGRVTILCSTSVPWLAPILRGVRSYVQTKANWRIFQAPSALFGVSGSAAGLKFLRDWEGDGIIATSNSEVELECIRKRGIPAVNLSSDLHEPCGVPRVVADYYQAGRLAAEHLVDAGFRNLAFLGRQGLWYSDQRRQGFCDRAAESGITCNVLLQGADQQSVENWRARIAEIMDWVTALPRPTGVFAVHDYRANMLMEACHAVQLRIPLDIAVIGLDNDKSICENTIPTLSSVSCNPEQVGWEAASLLDRLMNGEASPRDSVFVAPDRVVARQSTDVYLSADPLTQRALEFMRLHMKKLFNINEMASRLGVSKRSLETHFRDSLGNSPHDILGKMRVKRALTLLQSPEERSMKQIASECGFGSISAFYETFKAIAGESPGAIRKKYVSR